MHQSLQGATFHIEHIVPQSAGGSNSLGNLPLACPSCNFAKSDRTRAIDPETFDELPLFNPRIDTWGEHFECDRERNLIGRTPVGRVTVRSLNLNHPRRVLIREAEEWFELFPP